MPAASYTINPVECSTRGTYRVHINDACGDSSAATGEIKVRGCP
jgi:hypothetical protein